MKRGRKEKVEFSKKLKKNRGDRGGRLQFEEVEITGSDGDHGWRQTDREDDGWRRGRGLEVLGGEK